MQQTWKCKHQIPKIFGLIIFRSGIMGNLRCRNFRNVFGMHADQKRNNIRYFPYCLKPVNLQTSTRQIQGVGGRASLKGAVLMFLYVTFPPFPPLVRQVFATCLVSSNVKSTLLLALQLQLAWGFHTRKAKTHAWMSCNSSGFHTRKAKDKTLTHESHEQKRQHLWMGRGRELILPPILEFNPPIAKGSQLKSKP